MFSVHWSDSEQSHDTTSAHHFRALGKTVVTLRKCTGTRVYFSIVYILFTTLHAMFRIIKCTTNNLLCNLILKN